MDVKNMQAVIIAGGKGTRVSGYTKEIPKPMIRIAGKTVLERQIEALKANGINNIIITVGYLKDIIIDYFGDGMEWGVNITYIEENEPLGTAGAFFYLKNVINDTFFVIFGDIIFDIDVSKFYEFHKNHGKLVSLIAHPNSHPYDSNLIVCDENNLVKKIAKKNENELYYNNLVNAGAYIFEKQLLDSFKEKRVIDNKCHYCFYRESSSCNHMDYNGKC